MGIQVTVRDGRIGRDMSLDGEDGGAVLTTFEVETPFGPEDEGKLITLPDGSQWPMIGYSERVNDQGWSQTVFIGTM